MSKPAQFTLFVLLALVSLFLSSCGGGEWDINLLVQRIPDSSKVIYEYDAWGGRDSHKFGIVIMDSTEEFEVNRVRNLPISYFTHVPNSKQVYAVSLQKADDEDVSLHPVQSRTTRVAGMELVIDYYRQYDGYSDAGCGLNEYEFMSFRETEDSLYLIGLKKDFGLSLEGKDTVGFQKGNIKLLTDSDGKVMRIEIEELFKGKANKYRYKKGTIEVSERTENSPVVCLRTYYFKPLKDIYSGDFTDYGIFKPIIKNSISDKAYE